MKRLMDVAISVVFLVILAPLIVAAAFLVRVYLGKPICFRQMRPGLHGKPFFIYKFRTMTDESDKEGNPLPDSIRLTQFGRLLRATSLDELPALLNVLNGTMSLVGPRPLLMQYLDRYTPEQAHRHNVKPGITGWAQVNGRNAITWEEKFKLDLWYVDNWSLGLDLRILWMTVWKILKRDGINQPGQATMAEFTGSPDTHQEARHSTMPAGEEG